MSGPADVVIAFHGETFFELQLPPARLFIDPVLSSTRRGRRPKAELGSCHYLVVTSAGDGLDDVLDLLDGGDATLVGPPRICETARQELKLSREDLLDLRAWERAGEAAFKITAVPMTPASLFDDGMSAARDAAEQLGRVPGGRRGLEALGPLAELPRMLSRLPLDGQGLPGARLLEDLAGMVGAGSVLGGLRGGAGQGYLFEPTSGQKILHLAAGLHHGTDEAALEQIAELAPSLDVLIAEAVGASAGPLVRAVRTLKPRTVLLYRSQDPYGRGRRAQTVPMSAFIEALAEDQGEAVEALHLKAGDRFTLEAKKPTAVADKPVTKVG